MAWLKGRMRSSGPHRFEAVTGGKIAAWLRILVQFSRPHTIVGTSLSVSGLYLIALASAGVGQPRLGAFALTLISALAANIFIVGLNQITDVEIDRINKPELPLAAGALSLSGGRAIVIASLVLSLLIALLLGRYLLITVVAGMAIGAAYSLPPLRLKRFDALAAICISSVRGLLINVFLYLHFSWTLTGVAVAPLKIWVLAAFIIGFGLVIAWFKDIPDMEGDRRFQIVTLSLRLGAGNVFNLGRVLLSLCYLGLIAAGLLGLPGVNGPVLVASHLLLLVVMWAAGRNVVLTDKASITRYYMFIWRLFFLEYLFYPLACLLA